MSNKQMSDTVSTYNNMTIEAARQIAARCWGDENTAHLEMDPELCEVIAQTILDVWNAGYATRKKG